MQLNKRNILLATLSASLLLSGCVGDNGSTMPAASNGSLAETKSLSGVLPLVLRANDHHIEKPSDEKKKEDYDRIKDRIVVDNDTNKTAEQAKKDSIHQLLEKVPSGLTQQFYKSKGEIKLISDNWRDSLHKGGVKISPETKVINKFGKPVHISDAIVYFDPNSQTPTIYVNSNINYENNADNRKELEYGLIRGLIKSNNVIFDEGFVDAVKSYTQVDGIEFYNYPELAAISQFSAEDIQLAVNQDKLVTLFASIMADALENRAYIKTWSVMTSYLDKIEAINFAEIHNLNERYFGSNIVGKQLTEKEKQTVQSVHRLIINNIYDSPTAMYENLIFRDKIDKSLMQDLDDAIYKLVDKKNNTAISTTSINLEISDDEINSLMKSIFGESPMLNDKQKYNILDFVRKNYKFNSILSKYYLIKNSVEHNFGLQYASLLAAKLAVCDNFAILNYFILKQTDEFKNDLMIPAQIGSGHTVLAVQHKGQIYIADSWISYLHADEKIKPFFGELDTYLTYIDQNFAGKKESTWHEYGRYDALKNIITSNINEAQNDNNYLLILFAGKGIDLTNEEQVNIINKYLYNLKQIEINQI